MINKGTNNIQRLFIFFNIFLSIFWHFSNGIAEGYEERKISPDITEKEENHGTDEKPCMFTSLTEKAVLSGLIELNYEFSDIADPEDKHSGHATDFYVGSVELALDLLLNKWIRTEFIVNAEDIGKDGEKVNIILDEAVVILKCPNTPFYLIAGRTVLPFGVFEDHMISGTLTEDLYEIKDTGVTLGFTPDYYDFDISLTIYDGNNVIKNLEDFGAIELSESRNEERKVNSFIFNISLEPLEDVLSVSTFYNNESGDGRRNQTLGGALTFNVREFTLDVEYIKALSREKGEDAEENLESAGLVGLSFKPSEKLELASRYEFFIDDYREDRDGILKSRYLAGFNYSFTDFATFSFEYRHCDYEKERGSNAADEENEFIFQLSLEF